jgi:hypothetical protein
MVSMGLRARGLESREFPSVVGCGCEESVEVAMTVSVPLSRLLEQIESSKLASG